MMEQPPAQKSILADAVDQQTNTQVSPEKQAIYNRVAPKALGMIHSPKTRDQIVKRLGVGDPVQAVAQVTIMILTQVTTSAKEAKYNIHDDVLAIVGHEVINNLIEVSEAAGIHKFTDEEKEAAMYAATDLYLQNKEKSGELDLTGFEEMTEGKVKVPDKFKGREMNAMGSRAANAQPAPPPQRGPVK